MSRSYRIKTTPGEDNGYLKVNVDLNQNYDHLEILSLKISQKDDYQSYCADYGVVAGRVIVNGGFGVPNVKVSIFIPVEDSDLLDPVKSAIYPYTEPFPNQKNKNGLRYNVLPKNQQTLDHTPVGSFPKKREILDDRTTLEIYEKYYKYTTTTNEAGDYILFGIPVGDHFLHYDMDVSDIGFISTRPFELIDQGYSDNLFKSKFRFKSSNNLDSLPQIFSENLPIRVEPYWCDSLSTGSALGINRYDIEPNFEVVPTAIFMGSIFSDDEKDSLNKNCKPAREMGKLNEVITGGGKIEAIRRTVDGNVEIFDFKEDSIDDNGNWSVLVPMNLRKVVTDEFGNLIPSPDGIKGIATEGDYRFRISMDATSNDKRLRERAKYLVPNTNNNFNFGEFTTKELRTKQIFTKNEQLSDITIGTPYENDVTNQYNYLEEFFPFRWKKVYTVKQYIGRMQKVRNDEARGFIGIKDIINAEGVNKFPSNRIDTNFNPLYTIICLLLTFFATVVGFINGILNVINGLITAICNIKFPVGICIISNKGSRARFYVQSQSYDEGSSCWKPTGNDGGVQFLSSCGNFREGDGSSPVGSANNPYSPCIDVNNRSNPPDDENSGNCGLINYNDMAITIQGNTGNGATQGTPKPSVIWNINELGNPGNGPVQHPSATSVTDWWYNYASCKDTQTDGCRRMRVGKGILWYLDLKCDECGLSQPCPDGGVKILGNCFYFKFRCIFGGALCKNCKDVCALNQHSCCSDSTYGCPSNDSICGGTQDCCTQCCAKIPLIPLKCADEGKEYRISLIKSPFADSLGCNATYVRLNSCLNCGGQQTPGIKDWVSCVMEPVAVFLRMLKFDFYNDWVGGSLYFPLIKRKYKLKKSKRKFGQIKKDKFCDFECRERGNNTNFQGNPTFKQWRIKIPNLLFTNPTITVNGCTAKIKGKRVTDWYGTEDNDDETFNLNQAVKEITFNGNTSSQDGCIIEFNTFQDLQNTLNSVGINNNLVKDREVTTEHGKPEYVETEDANGFSTWENIGGHGHHRNICDNTRMVERKEYFKSTLDCDPFADFVPPSEFSGDTFFGGIEEPVSEDDNTSDTVCVGYDCTPDCGTNGVRPCVYNESEYDSYVGIIKHGLISWEEGDIYYTPYIPSDDVKYNSVEYKANLMLPTTIMELGSSVYCDIDDVPFIMDQIPPTTFNVSYEDIKYKFKNGQSAYSGSEGLGVKKTIKTYEDKKNISLNLRAYVEFSCTSTVCSNIAATVNQSQVGVEIIDKNDIGIEIGSCFLRFDHDADIREYFCRRFNGYKGDDLSFHHQKPGSVQNENEYNTYPEITLSDGTNLYYELPDEDGNEIVYSEYNDGDSFIPGDGCGYVGAKSNGDTDYFYGLAPGQTSGFIPYPNGGNTIIFGQTAQNDNIDEILQGGTLTDDQNNGSVDIKGIKFNRSQTPYYLYFGLVPGKTALHKTVSNFFADRINEVTLQGLEASNDSVEENINNSPNINGGTDNPFSVYRTCLGETLLQTNVVDSATQNNNTTGGGSQGNNNPSGGSGGSTSSGSGGSGGNNPSGGGTTTPNIQPNLGPFLGGNPQTGGNNQPINFTLLDSNNQTFNGDVTITSAPCTVNGEVTETRNFTIEVNSGSPTININMYGGGTFNLCPQPPITSGTAFNVKINDGNGGPINQTIVSETVPIYNNSTQSYTINNIGTYEVQIEVIPYFTFDGFEISVSVS
jgi:hypothetical protein